MKKLTYLIAFSFSFQAYAQTPTSSDYTINGKVANFNSGKIYVLSPDGKAVDSATIVKGRFVLSGKVDLAQKGFRISPGNYEFSAYVDVPRITFYIDTAEAEHYYSQGKDHVLIPHIKETGSPIADAFDAFQKETGMTEGAALMKKLKTAKKDSAAAINNRLETLQRLFPEKEKLWVENYVRQNPASIPAVYMFYRCYNQINNSTCNFVSATLTHFSGPAKASSYYKELTTRLAAFENAQAGKPAPDFTLLQRDKSELKLSTTRGSIIMLDFWASWCKPCRAGIPDWKKVYEKYHAKGFDIISISDDRNWADWVKALDQEKMPWLQVIDEFPAANVPAIVGKLYSVPSMPYFVLLDKKGEIIIGSDDEAVVTKKIEELLN